MPSPIGYSIPGAVHHTSRVSRPMIRRGWLEGGPGDAGGARGRDSFVPVEWGEALDLVTGELRRVSETHGNSAIFGGSYGWASAGRFHHAQSQVHRFLNCVGGYTYSVNSYSTAAAQVIVPPRPRCEFPRDDVAPHRVLGPSSPSIRSWSSMFGGNRRQERASQHGRRHPARHGRMARALSRQWRPVRQHQPASQRRLWRRECRLAAGHAERGCGSDAGPRPRARGRGPGRRPVPGAPLRRIRPLPDLPVGRSRRHAQDAGMGLGALRHIRGQDTRPRAAHGCWALPDFGELVAAARRPWRAALLDGGGRWRPCSAKSACRAAAWGTGTAPSAA